MILLNKVLSFYPSLEYWPGKWYLGNTFLQVHFGPMLCKNNSDKWFYPLDISYTIGIQLKLWRSHQSRNSISSLFRLIMALYILGLEGKNTPNFPETPGNLPENAYFRTYVIIDPYGGKWPFWHIVLSLSYRRLSDVTIIHLFYSNILTINYLQCV